MQRRTRLHVRKAFGYLIIGLATTVMACADADSPVAPDLSDQPTDLANVRTEGFRDRLTPSSRQGQCALRVKRGNGEYRYTRRAIRFPRGSEHPQKLTRKFIYVSRATPGADPVRFAVCDIPATAAAISHMERLVLRMNRNAKMTVPPGRGVRDGGIVRAQPAQSANASTTQSAIESTQHSVSANTPQAEPSFIMESTGGCVEAGVCTLDPIVVIGTPSGEECDKYQELDWECECDGPGVDYSRVSDECDEWEDDDEDDHGGIGGSDGGEVPPPPEVDSPVESMADDQGANKYGCVGNVEYPHRSAVNPSNVDVHATTVCAVALPELYVRVSLSVRKVIMGVGYWDEVAASAPVALTFVREVRTTASGPCVPGQYRAESDHHATGLEGEYLGSPRKPWRIMTVTCDGEVAT